MKTGAQSMHFYAHLPHNTYVILYPYVTNYLIRSNLTDSVQVVAIFTK